MPFMSVEKTHTNWTNSIMPTIRMGVHTYNSRKEGNSQPRIYLSISLPILVNAGITLHTLKDRVRTTAYIDIQEGAGADAGFLLLSSTTPDKGYALGTTAENAKSCTSAFLARQMKHYVLGQSPVSAHPVEYTVDEKEHTILIQCPSWLIYNPRSFAETKEDRRLPQPNPTQVVQQPAITKEKVNAARTELAKAIVEDVPANRRERRMMTNAVAKALRP